MRAILIHGFQGHPMHGWRPWLKKELEGRGWQVSVPAMPAPGEPKCAEWVAAIAAQVDGRGGDCILVGHSLGCTAILRYLEDAKTPIAGALLVAGFAEGLGREFRILANFLEKPFDWGAIRRNCPNFIALFSDNDPYVPLSQEKLFKARLGAKTAVLHGRGHFSSSEGAKELPEALEAALSLAENGK